MTDVLRELYRELEIAEDVQNVMQEIADELSNLHIVPSVLQWQILLNHVNEMVMRSKEKTTIPQVDAQLFSEISPASLQLAEKIVTRIGHLAQDEKYLLSIHFEAAKGN